jgi:poly(3-hydroxyalkanoate) synthetase
MTAKSLAQAHHYPEIGVPMFWPFSLAVQAGEAGLDLSLRNLEYVEEVEKTQVARPRPAWATPNREALALHTLTLRDFSTGDAAPVLILPPYAGHTSTIADFHEGQSLVRALRDSGCLRLFAIDWRSAAPRMQYYDVDDYLAEVNVCVDELGGRVALVGLCQGGWCAALYAARYPHKVARLVLAGSPIHTAAGEGAIKDAARTLPMSFYEGLVRSGGGLLRGAYMLEGFKNMHPEEQYLGKFVELYEHIDDPSYRERFEQFERWYESTVDLPGAWYLQVIQQLFKENRFAKGEFVGLGKRLNLKDVTCPVYLLAGAEDDITPKEQVFGAEPLLGSRDVTKALAPGGHIGLFMSHKVLETQWPSIGSWLVNS